MNTRETLDLIDENLERRNAYLDSKAGERDDAYEIIELAKDASQMLQHTLRAKSG